MTDAPSDVEALRVALAAARVEAAALAEEAARARAMASGAEAVIATLKLEIEKLRRALYGQRSERRARLLDQLELQLEELEAAASEDELAAERAAPVAGRRHPARKPFPAHLPRERVVIEAPCACAACGSERIAKLGEDSEPSRRHAFETDGERDAGDGPAVVEGDPDGLREVRLRSSGRLSPGQSPGPPRLRADHPTAIRHGRSDPWRDHGSSFHPTPRGWAGPNLLATILFETFGQHQPLNRQAERYAREGVEPSLSTLADQVGAAAVALPPCTR